MRRALSMLLSSGLLALSVYSLGVLLYDLSSSNFRAILNNALLRTPNVYHLIAAPLRSLGTVIAFIFFIPFLRLFLVNHEVAIAVFIVIQIASLLVLHLFLIAVSLAYLSRSLKKERAFLEALDVLLPGLIEFLSNPLSPLLHFKFLGHDLA